MQSLIRAELLFPNCFIKVEPKKDLFEYNFYDGRKFFVKISYLTEIARRWTNLKVIAAKKENEHKLDFKKFKPMYDLLAQAMNGELHYSQLITLLERVCPYKL